MRVMLFIACCLVPVFLVSACQEEPNSLPSEPLHAPQDASPCPDAIAHSAEVMMSPEQLAPQEPLRPGLTTLWFDQMIGGETVRREVILHAPEMTDPSRRYPLVFAFHGSGGAHTDWTRAFRAGVEAGEMVGVYPQAYNRRWNINDTDDPAADDVAFVEEIAARLTRYTNLDSTRRFSFGVSTGGALAHRLGVETKLFNAIVAIVAQLSRGQEPTDTSGTVGVLQVLGMEDRLVPYRGGPGPMALEFYSAEESAEIWATHNECALPGVRTRTEQGNTLITYDGCNDGVRVMSYGIRGAGHGMPGNVEGGLAALGLSFFSATP